jgi:protein phosphatase 1 regulatory subunit 3A/B/C/D/E
LSRQYNYGISGLTYTSDLTQLQGSIAVYALSFAQPASDYLKFRNRINEKNVSLENVVLNRFQLSGTIKVKNISYSKQVFVRTSFNKWTTFEDHLAQYVANDTYSSSGGGGGANGGAGSSGGNVMSSPTSSSLSATFYSLNRPDYSMQPKHKEFDTFRFEFELPRTAQENASADPNNSVNASIQFCVCYRTDNSGEFWDSNEGKNYEILQYIIDAEKLKPSRPHSRGTGHHHHHRSNSTAGVKQAPQTSNYFKFNEPIGSGINGSKSSYSSPALSSASGEVYY